MKVPIVITLTLMAISALVQAEIHPPHCLAGCPEGVSATNDLIVRDIYTISSNDKTKFTDWSAYRVTTETIGSGCKRKWRPDPILADVETLEPDDYKGAHAAIGIDRGHQVPLASVCGTSDWEQANYLSNITPQASELNQGPWKNLEEAVRKLAKQGKEMYVLTGPLYEREMPPLPNTDENHNIPSGYWKVIAIQTGKTIETASYVMEQSSGRRDNFCTKQVKLSVIESRSNLDLFPSLPADFTISEKLALTLCPD